MISILYIFHSTEMAGAQKEWYQVIENTSRNLFLPLIIVHDKGPLYDYFQERGEQVYVFRRYFGRFDLFYYLRLVIFCLKKKVRLLLLSNRIPAIFVAPFGIKSIQRRNQPTQQIEKLGRFPFINRFLFRAIDCVLCCSESIYKNILENENVSPDKLKIIYNGISLKNLPRANQEAFRTQYYLEKGKIIGLVGRLHPQKGSHYFLESIPLILEEEPDCWFIFCGGGILEQSLKEKADSLGITNRIRFLGFQKEPLKILSCLDISVMSSLWEGFPFVALETFAVQKPLVATNVGGIPELVDEQNGILVAPEDPKALAEGVLDFLRNPEKAQEMAYQGYLKVKQYFDVKYIAKKTERLYLEVLRRKK